MVNHIRHNSHAMTRIINIPNEYGSNVVSKIKECNIVKRRPIWAYTYMRCYLSPTAAIVCIEEYTRVVMQLNTQYNC